VITLPPQIPRFGKIFSWNHGSKKLGGNLWGEKDLNPNNTPCVKRGRPSARQPSSCRFGTTAREFPLITGAKIGQRSKHCSTHIKKPDSTQCTTFGTIFQQYLNQTALLKNIYLIFCVNCRKSIRHWGFRFKKTQRTVCQTCDCPMLQHCPHCLDLPMHGEILPCMGGASQPHWLPFRPVQPLGAGTEKWVQSTAGSISLYIHTCALTAEAAP